MTKSATEVIQDAVFSAVIDAMVSLKTNSNGVPNTMLREINSMHANSTFADLPSHLQETIKISVNDTLKRLRKEGYSVAALDLRKPTPSKTSRNKSYF